MRTVLAALALLAAGLAGCTSPPSPAPPPEAPYSPFGQLVDESKPLDLSDRVFSAREAAALALPVARAAHPDAVVVGAEATESNASDPGVQRTLRLLGVGLDPDVGDGLVEGWAVRFRASAGVFRVDAYANGTARLEPRPPIPPDAAEGDLGLWAIDSPQAMAVAMADAAFRGVVRTPEAVVRLLLSPPSSFYEEDPGKRVFATDPYWWFAATEPNRTKADVRVNARTAERIVASPEGSVAHERFAHEHASFAVFIRGQRVGFDDGAYDITNITGKVHMHTLANGTPLPGGGSVWHLEGAFDFGIPNLTLAEILGQYGLTFRPGLLILDRHDGHDGSAWPDEGPDAWRVFVSRVSDGKRGPFAQPAGDPVVYTPRDLDEVLFTYGHADAAELAREQAAVPEPRP